LATSTYPSKRFYNCALKQASTWGTAVAVGAGDGLLVSSDGNPSLKQTYSSTDAIGQVMALDGDLGLYEPIDFAPEFGGKCGLQYAPGAVGSAIAALFGSEAVAQQGASAAYKHTLTWADTMTDFFTFATERPGDIWEVPSAVCYKLSLKLGDGKVQGSIGLRGNLLKNDSTTNTATQLDAVTPEATANFVKFQHGVVRMNAQSGDALDSGDIIEVSDFSLEFERAVDAQHILGGSYIAQPKEASFSIKVKLTLPYATSTNVAYLDLFKDMTAQKMDIVFTGGVADTGYNYSFSFFFPRLKLVAPPDVKLEDIIKNGLEFVAEEAASAPTGMNSTRPYIEIVNLRTTNYIS